MMSYDVIKGKLHQEPPIIPPNSNMATGNLSLEEMLNERPSLAELCKYLPISTKWYQMGIQLELNTRGF